MLVYLSNVFNTKESSQFTLYTRKYFIHVRDFFPDKFSKFEAFVSLNRRPLHCYTIELEQPSRYLLIETTKNADKQLNSLKYALAY